MSRKNTRDECIQIDSEFWEGTVKDLDRPLRDLLCAILERAIRDLVHPPGSYGHKAALAAWEIRYDARAWISSKWKGEWSFHFICCHLLIDEDRMRNRLKAMKLLDHESDPCPDASGNAEVLAIYVNGDRERA